MDGKLDNEKEPKPAEAETKGNTAGEAEESKSPSGPTTQEISDYAEYLGLRPGEDGELLWIAEQALLAPLPEGWKEVEDHKGNVLYLNTNGDAQYAHPCDEEYKGLFHAFKAVLADPVSREEVLEMARYLGIDVRTEQSLLWMARQCVIAPLPHGWEEIEDEKGGPPYFRNKARGITSREHPLDNIFRILVVTERNKLNEKSLVRVGNTGGSSSVQMRLIRSDGSALYTYDWSSGTVSDVHPLNAGKQGESKAKAAESKTSDLPKSLVEDLQKKGILEDSTSAVSTSAAATKPNSDESEPVMPPIAQGRMPLTSRKSGFPSIQRKQKAAKVKRAKNMKVLPMSSFFFLLAYINPISWVLFFIHRIKMMVRR